MSEEFDQEQSQSYKRLFPPHYWILILLVAGIVIYFVLPERAPFRNPKIAAESYVWPRGCEQKDYEVLDYIAKSCMGAGYEIPEWKQYGWSAGGNSKGFEAYYRVGNDAVAFHYCDLDHIGKCQIGDKISSVFVGSGENK